MKLLKLIVLSITAVFIFGCASVDITKTAKGFYTPTNPNEVEILKTIPDREFIELGTVDATGFKAGDTAKMHNAMRTKAAKLGATAVILTEEGFIPGGWTGQKWSTAVAIRYKDID